MQKKIIAIVTVIVIVISIIPISVSADNSYDGTILTSGTEIILKDVLDTSMLEYDTTYNINFSSYEYNNPLNATGIKIFSSLGMYYLTSPIINVYKNNAWLNNTYKTMILRQSYTLHDNDAISQFIIANAASGLPVETDTETETETETETDSIIINNNILVGTVIPDNTLIRFKNAIVEQVIDISTIQFTSNSNSYTGISGYYSGDDNELGYGYIIDYGNDVVYANTENYQNDWANGYREITLTSNYTVNNIEVAQFFSNNIEYIYPALETTNQDNVINSTKTIFQSALENTTNIIEFILFNPIAIISMIIYIAIVFTIVIRRIIAGV